MPDLQIRNDPHELRLLFEVGRALDGSSEISNRLESILELMARYTGMLRGRLLLADPAGRGIVREAAYGLKASLHGQDKERFDGDVTGRVLEAGAAALVPRTSGEPLFVNRAGARKASKEEIAFLCVPILIGGKAVGALSADRLFADSVCLSEDLRLLRTLASLIARAVRLRREAKALHAAVVEENKRLQRLLHGNLDQGLLVGSSAAMRTVLEEIAQVTGAGSTVLIRGESGTGKELVAGIIHANSQRGGRPFVKVNCAALPEALVESELFGHERGAVAGVVGARKGRFEMAHGGTLFLDEVGDMTPLTQAKLLRAVQEQEFERVGGSETLRVDVRLIAATSRNLEEMVAHGEFRQDLYYRLSVFPLFLPPLRERRDDIMALVTHFVDKACADNKRKVARITAQAADMLRAYPWPGNVRELENVIERAVILCGLDGVIDARHLPVWLQGGRSSGIRPHVRGTVLEQAVAALEKELIVEALEDTGGNMSRAAQRLGVTERVMGLRMKKFGLDYRDFRRSNAGLSQEKDQVFPPVPPAATVPA